MSRAGAGQGVMVAVALGIVGIFLIAGLSIFRLFVDPGSSALEAPDGFAHFIKAVWPSSSSNCGKNEPLKDCAQPRANPDDATVDEDASVVIDVLANDRGLRDGGIEVEVTTSPLHGQYSITSGNAIAYTPVANFNGSDSLVYRVTDVNGDSSSAEVSITIAPVNDPPTVRKDVAYTYFEKSVQIDALANDSTAPDEGESLTIAELGMPEYGSVTVDSAGLIAYDPGTSYGTFDKFTYVVSDGNGATASAEVVVVRNSFYGNAVIEGRITDQSGAPVYGVWVNAYGLTGTTEGKGWTDLDGYYRIPNLRTGDYWVHFNPPDGSNFVRESYNNIRCCGQDPERVHVVNGQTTSGIDAVLDEGGIISGRVTDSSGNPIEGITVYGSETDADGRYEIKGLATGDYRISFSSTPNGEGPSPAVGNYLSEVYNDKRKWDEGDFVHVEEGGRVDGIDASLAPGGRILGRLVDEAGNPIANLRVHASLDPPGHEGQAVTDESGNYTIEALAGGTYRVRFNGFGTVYLSEWYDGSDSYQAAQLVEVIEGTDVLGIDAVMARGGTISGVVTDESGNPLPEVSVAAYPSENSWFPTFATTDESGRYMIKALKPESYRIQFQNYRGTHIGEWYNDKASQEIADVVEIVGSSDVIGIDASLARAASISGRVYDEGGNPLPGARVEVLALDQRWITSAATDGSGLYKLVGLSPGTYKLKFNAPYGENFLGEWHADRASFAEADPLSIDSAGQEITGIDAVLSPGASISGLITDIGGNPLRSVNVTLKNLNGNFAASTSTDSLGHYQLVGLVAGDYRVLFGSQFSGDYVPEWYDNKATELEGDIVSLAEREHLVIDASLARYGSISGRVTDEFGNPINQPFVVATRDAPFESFFARSLGDGNFSIKLPPGSYRVQFGAENYNTEWYKDKPSSSEADPITVAEGQDVTGIDAVLELTNRSPVAFEDNAFTVEDTPVVIDLVANDRDLDGDPLTIVSAFGATYGSVEIVDAHRVRYTPCGDCSGEDQFTYQITDGRGGYSAATLVYVEIPPINDVPVALDDYLEVEEDASLKFDPRSNDYDVDGDPLTIDWVAPPSNGTAVVNEDGTITYTPEPNYYGSDAFSYEITDGAGGRASANIEVSIIPAQDPPVAREDFASTNEDRPLVIEVVANDSDVDGDFLTIVSAGGASLGEVEVEGAHLVRYTPCANCNGSDQFTYQITDGHGGYSETTSVFVEIFPINDVPVTLEDFGFTDEDSPVVLNLVANDSDADGDPLRIVSAGGASLGEVEIIDDHRVTYTPCRDCNGSDQFSYQVTDGQGGYSQLTGVFVEIWSINDPPVARDDFLEIDEDAPVNFDARSNDSDVDGDSLSVRSITKPSHGDAVLNGDGTISYTPDPNYHGSDAFTYRISDGGTDWAAASVELVINPVQDAPAAVEDSGSTDEDAPVVIDVVANDSDVDGDPLSVVSVNSPSHGIAALNDDGTITYSPEPNYHGSDGFSYEITDGAGGRASASVEVVISPVQDAPVAVEDSGSTDEDSSVIIDVVANDSDVDGDPLAIDTVTTPSHGTAVSNGDGTVTYTPEPNYHGSDGFSYEITDGAGGRASANVEMVINAVQDAPVAREDFVETVWPAPVTIDVLANDEFFDGLASVEIVTQPMFGRAIVNPDFSITYAPLIFLPSETFVYAIVDLEGDRTEATVTVSMRLLSPLPGPQ